ncbi:MAG: hypothetical protein AVDCRST_MAG26-4650 [uncultured Chloroflexia bacterium]|uniref:Uncharacterized protein n=1 Tax=uncultured Chloroflexia bacterium TaxID=1672391 RepID=A0A6J4K9I4_9CHLR|nr:MAG: hypothetical protein AVDCRST_MAG26-4650 [uncultured Chloroflexia bacterium]
MVWSWRDGTVRAIEGQAGRGNGGAGRAFWNRCIQEEVP